MKRFYLDLSVKHKYYNSSQLVDLYSTRKLALYVFPELRPKNIIFLCCAKSAPAEFEMKIRTVIFFTYLIATTKIIVIVNKVLGLSNRTGKSRYGTRAKINFALVLFRSRFVIIVCCDVVGYMCFSLSYLCESRVRLSSRAHSIKLLRAALKILADAA